MKDRAIDKISRVVRSIVNAILGDGLTKPTDHVRRVRGTNVQDINC